MISIIIPKCQDITYRIRCLNSIVRQSYKNYEIIVIGNDYTEEIIKEYKLKVVNIKENDEKLEGIQEAIKIANGDFIFFCSITSILAADVLQKLRTSIIDDKISIVSANYLIKENNVFQEKIDTIFLLLGKLWKKEVLEFTGTEIEEAILQEQVYIYETDETAYEYSIQLFNEELFEKLVKAYLNSVSMKDVIQKNIVNILNSLEHIKLQNIIVTQLTTEETIDFEFKYQLAKDYVYKWYQMAEKNLDEEPFAYVKEYLTLIKNREDFLFVILQLLGINKTQYQNINKYNIRDWIFFKNKLIEEKALENNWLQQWTVLQENRENQWDVIKKELFALQEENLNKVSSLQNEVSKLGNKVASYANTTKKESNVIVSMPEGNMLAEYIINTYGEGKLGLKTIIKALGAWLKYKIFGNKVK